jgi:cytochrome c-type biogenesis protein CcmH/NrfG
MNKSKLFIIITCIVLAVVAFQGIWHLVSYYQGPYYALKKSNPQKYEQLKKNEQDLRAKIKKNDLDQNSWIELGVIYEAYGDYNKAVESYKKAIEISEATIMGWINIANCYIQLEQYAKAEDAYRNFIRIYPDSTQGYDALAHLFVSGKWGTKEDAMKVYEQGIDRTNDEFLKQYLEDVKYGRPLP